MEEIHSQQALPPGTMVQEYRIIRVLGAGSFGIVYTAENTHFNEYAAQRSALQLVNGWDLLHCHCGIPL